MRIKTMIALAGIICIVSVGYVFWHRDIPVEQLIPEEKIVIDSLFTKTKPQCLGRYIFDVPDVFVNVLNNVVRINDMHITSKRLYFPAFEQQIRLREQELRNSHTVDSRDQPFLKQVHWLSDNAVIFDRNENESVAGFGRILEGHIYADGVAFVVTQVITDYSDERYVKERKFYLRNEVGRSASMANTKPKKMAEMQDLLSRLSGRKDDEIPTQPGACISEGFISDKGKRYNEEISFAYKNTDFTLGIKSDNSPGENISLLERSDEMEVAIRKGNYHTMRKGEVLLTRMNGEEWLVKGKQEVSDMEKDLYRFIFYANEKITDYHHPLLSIKLNNYDSIVQEYNSAQLVDIWDRITRSFRLRPGAF